VPDDSALLVGLVPEERSAMRPLAEAYSEDDLLRILDVLTRLETDLRWAQDPRVTLELSLLKMVQMRRLVPFAELVDRVERLAAGAPAPAPPRLAASAPLGPSVRPPAAAPAPARTTAPAPAPRAPAVPSGPADGAADILAAMIGLAAARPSLAQPLRGAQARLEGDTLMLEVPPDFSAFSSMHVDDYQDLARKAAGRALKVQVGAAPAAAVEAPLAPAEVKKRRLMEEASREPAVQEALDLFGGKVVEVRETKP
jgi:DNA polymerase III gamma/tau subunit